MPWRSLATFLLLLGAVGSSFFATPVLAAERFTILTEELPPFSYTEQGKIAGMNVEIVRAVLKRLDHPDTIAVNIWSRAYNLTLSHKGHGLFSTIRTPERESLFKWVGPLQGDKTVFFARKGSGITLRTLDDARRVKSIGVYKDDMSEEFLLQNGFTNLDSVLDDSMNVRKLASGRIDLWCTGLASGLMIARRLGLSDRIEEALVLVNDPFYIAFNRQTPDEEVARWQAALDAVKKSGEFDEIMAKYGYRE
ncbi:MAG: transporter substrate-binding domain-containing protein [Nitrospinae bacterium]|nr:transporter substrate-binding domain-containing protein [Nitrospinota bacterium]